MDRENLKECLKETVGTMSLEQFSRLFINEVTAIEEFFKLCHGVKAGNTISLLFNPHRLNIITEEAVTKISVPMSIYESLSDKGSDKYTEKIDGLARLYLYNLEHGTNNPFYATVQRGYNGVAYVNEFPPYIARNLYLRYGGGNKNLRVLDPCCGWGGRMIGCASIPNTTYVGCEPSTATYEGLLKLGEWLKVLQPTFNYEIYKLPYEDFKSDEHFDMALTSPPYYNTEQYCDEETNSLNRYKTYGSWVEGFYRPLILNTMRRIDGAFILNVGDRRYTLSKDLMSLCEQKGIYCERLQDYLSSNSETGEKFYCLSNQKVGTSRKRLF